MELKKYKGFDDLPWQKRENDIYSSWQAILNFDNNYGVSVIFGGVAYSKPTMPYELGVLFNGKLHYETPVADGGVRGYLTQEEVNKYLKFISDLPKRKED